jgi:hypothetical protein
MALILHLVDTIEFFGQLYIANQKGIFLGCQKNIPILNGHFFMYLPILNKFCHLQEFKNSEINISSAKISLRINIFLPYD